MAPLKFRAWDTLKKKMFPVKALAFGYCDDMGFKGPEVLLMKGEPYDDEDMPNSLRGKSWDTAPTEGSSQYRTCIVMHSTGLNDKNGVEIFEGDIVGMFSKTQLSAVSWNEKLGAYEVIAQLSGGSPAGEQFLGNMLDTAEVIGNVWENPDLLSPTENDRQ